MLAGCASRRILNVRSAACSQVPQVSLVVGPPIFGFSGLQCKLIGVSRCLCAMFRAASCLGRAHVLGDPYIQSRCRCLLACLPACLLACQLADSVIMGAEPLL